MTNSNLGRLFLVCVATTTVAACGGGGGGATVAGIDGTGSPSPTQSLGTITAFGSVVVNGVRFETNNAEFTIDGVLGTQADLAVGDVVLVTGSIDDDDETTGIADTVVFDDAVEGPVDSVDLAGNLLIVLGQTVRVSSNTSFDDSFAVPSLAGIAPGDIVEVSGLRDSDGIIDATRIEPKPAGGAFETTGTVANLNSGAMTFSIGALVVDFSAAMLDDFDGGAIADGELVEVEGSIVSAGGALLATRVEFKGNDFDPDDGDRLEIEGFITRFVAPDDFDIAGIPVTITSSTAFEFGAPIDLGLNLKIEVEGSINAEGILVATKISIRRASAVRIAALVDSVDAAAGAFVVLGITVKSDALTRFEDDSDLDVQNFSVANLVAGDYVEVRGSEFPADSGEVLAARIERDDADTESELRGFVESVAEPVFTILGVQVTTNVGTNFEDLNDNPITSAAFFGALSEGDLVEAQGTEVADQAIVAEEAGFEDD